MLKIAQNLLTALVLGVQLGLGSTVIPLTHKCTEGATFVAELTGSMQKIAGVDTYVSLPTGTYNSKQAVILLTDIYGLASADSKTLADNFAAAGYATYVPDYFNGDPIPMGGNVDFGTWQKKHGITQTLPPLMSVIGELRTQGVTKIGATGYCFGGLYATVLAQNNTVDASSMAHPSLLTIPDDAETIKAKSKVPVQIHNAGLDTGLTPALAKQIDGILGDDKYPPGYNRTEWPGVAHGFAVRADATKPAEVSAKDGAFQGTISWFKKYL